jgi:hypothetical protein
VPLRRALIALAAGSLSLAVLVPMSSGEAPSVQTVHPPAARLHPVPVVPSCTTTAVAAGDFDGTASDVGRTGAVAVAQHPDLALLLGDIAYPDGTLAQIKAGIGATVWTSLASVTKPTPGNHDYRTAGAAGYFRYFGVPATYAFDIGCGWRGYSLDSEIPLASQVTWLKKDLGAHPGDRIVAIWHKPRYSSGKHGDNTSMSALWTALAGRKGVVLNGHDHDYERFAAKSGLREFVVGTGGTSTRTFTKVSSGSQVRIPNKPGILRLDLGRYSYHWSFLGTGGASLDSGSDTAS